MPILYLYISRIYLRYFLFISIFILFLLTILNTAEVQGRLKSVNVNFASTFVISIYKVPYLFQQYSIIIAFLSALFLLIHLRRTNELTIIYSSGISKFKIAMVIGILNIALGYFIILIVNPIAASFLERSERMQARALNKTLESAGLVNSKIVIRYSIENTKYIVFASSITKNSILNNVLAILSSQGEVKYINSKEALIDKDILKFDDASLYKDQSFEKHKLIQIPFRFSLKQLLETINIPETISIWGLPSMVKSLKRSGLGGQKHIIYFYKLHLKPYRLALISVFTFLFANNFLAYRRNNIDIEIFVKTLVAVLLIYFFSEVLLELLLVAGAVEIIAVGVPSVILFLSIIFLVLFEKHF